MKLSKVTGRVHVDSARATVTYIDMQGRRQYQRRVHLTPEEAAKVEDLIDQLLAERVADPPT
jgi:hypothetical protein